MDPAVQIKVTSSVCGSIAIASTIYRLFIRRKRLWVDDACALFSMLVLFVQIVDVFLDIPHPEPLSQKGKVIRYYLMAVTFYGIIWSARLSILFSMIRIDSSLKRRRVLMVIAVLFVIVWITLIAQLFWVCEPIPHWKTLHTPQCPLTNQVAIFQLVSDVIADSLLLIAPLRLLAIIRDSWLRYRLFVIFSTCIITTIVSLVHAVYILTASGSPNVIISAFVENAISLIVCNVPVVVASVVRLAGASEARRERRLPSFIKFKKMTSAQPSAVSHELTTISITQSRTIHHDHSMSYVDTLSLPKPRQSVESADLHDARKASHLMP